MPDARVKTASRSEEILAVAQDLMQTRGYNGFSYRDIAAVIGIKSASIHYHFPTKGDLGQAVMARYCDRFSQSLESLLTTHDRAKDRLLGYADLFRHTLVERQRLCLCGLLAGELETVPEPVKAEVKRFFETQHQWLTAVLNQAIASGEIKAHRDPHTWSTTLLAALEGAMLVSRGCDDNQHFEDIQQNLLDALLG
ncbi:MAG: TetR/AcrR family transcriptional regulator [Cyanobacteria bacterium J06627_32]